MSDRVHGLPTRSLVRAAAPGSPAVEVRTRAGLAASGTLLCVVGLLWSFSVIPMTTTGASPVPGAVLGVGLLLVLSAIVETRGSGARRRPTHPEPRTEVEPTATPASPTSAPTPGAPSVIAEPWDEDARESPERPRYVRLPLALDARPPPETSSIPGALMRPAWDESNELIPDHPVPASTTAAPLPFSAALHRTNEPPVGPVPLFPQIGRETDRPVSGLTRAERLVPDASMLGRSGARRLVAEPPAPRSTVASRFRECTACGTGLRALGTDPLCDGCGRPLCSDCYWRIGTGPERHRCPRCAAQAADTGRRSSRGWRPK